MPDMNVEAPAGSVQPHLSDAALENYRETMASYERTLADPDTPHAVREYITKMQKQIRDGVAYAGQSLEQRDERSDRQVTYDASHAMTPKGPSDYELEIRNSLPVGYEPEPDEGKTTGQIVSDLSAFCAAMNAPVALATCITRELLSSPEQPDPEKLAEALASMGKDYKAEIKDAEFAIRHAGALVDKVPFKAEQLPLFSLVQTALWGRHLQTWKSGRPQ